VQPLEQTTQIRRALLKQLCEPLDAIMARCGQRQQADRRLTRLEALDLLVRAGLVAADVARRYRAAYTQLRYGSGVVEPAEVQELRRALSSIDVEGKQVETLLRTEDRKNKPAVHSAEPNGFVMRPGWSTPPYVTQPPAEQSVARTEASNDSGVGWSGRRWILSLLTLLALSAWTAAVVGASYRMHRQLERLVYRVRFGHWPRPRVDRRLQELLDRVSDPVISESDRAQLMAALANLCYERDELLMAEHFYRAALERRPNDAELMNTLAWLLLTRGERWFQDVRQGYRLAKRAVELKPAPHIRDTLAEAHYLLGNYEEAIRIEEGVLRDEPNNGFYVRQLQKFRRALEQARRLGGQGNGEPGQATSARQRSAVARD